MSTATSEIFHVDTMKLCNCYAENDMMSEKMREKTETKERSIIRASYKRKESDKGRLGELDRIL